MLLPRARQGLLVYRVEILPTARRDLVDAARYIAQKLKNPDAAEKFLNQFEDRIASLSSMPYRRRAYVPLASLEHEYRAVDVGNYLAFYWVEEEPEQVVTIARVLFARSNYARTLGTEG